MERHSGSGSRHRGVLAGLPHARRREERKVRGSSVACRTSRAACCAQRRSPGRRHRSCGPSASARRTRTRRCARRASTSWRSTTAAPRSSAASCSPTCAGRRPSPNACRAAEFRDLLDRFYALATTLVIDHDGSIDKFVGDELVAMYFPLLSGVRHAERAVATAKALLEATGHAAPTARGCRWAPACTPARHGSARSVTVRAPT